MAKAITTNQRAIASFQVICMPWSLSFSPLLKSLNLLTIFRTKLRKHNYDKLSNRNGSSVYVMQ
ncbi:MAG: hypothetical protein IM473_06530 [Microcystis sp. M015S2]|uniref:hypothetical protein n=1 Tax=unclassified Microcystis TaxID=2643300 RepID=UPI002587F9C8|nr:MULTISPECIES: hypothetical protein [unclassified Microcystis]MCA2710846.1 hypothetical protein [Microcystis sp. M025S2]MCA2742078.1 hypothetical protein [Microcystis sp. M015S2]MCA2758253.1 hypothetical protein [Microcystis sp. M145S2]